MANDAPFATPAPAPAAPPPVDPAAPPSPNAPDPQAAARVLQEAIGGSLRPIMDEVRTLRAEVSNLKATPPPVAPAPASGDWIDKVADRDSLKEEVMGWVKEVVAPALLPVAEATRASGERAQIDRVNEYLGEGAWEEIVAPSYNAIMEDLRRTNPAATINHQHIQTVVDSILGKQSNQDAIAQRRAKQEAAKAAARQPAPRFAGPGRPTLAGDTDIDPEDRNIIDRIQRSLGKDSFTDKDLLEGRKRREVA